VRLDVVFAQSRVVRNPPIDTGDAEPRSFEIGAEDGCRLHVVNLQLAVNVRPRLPVSIQSENADAQRLPGLIKRLVRADQDLVRADWADLFFCFL
jgi:hypothetical protein